MTVFNVPPVELDGTVEIGVVTENGVGVPTDADAAPTYRVYDGGSLVGTGTAAALDNPTLSGTYRIAFTAASGTYNRGRNYLAVVEWAMSSSGRSAVAHFSVI